MVFNINAGFSGLVNESADDSESKNYALFIGDTVLVNEVSYLSHFITIQQIYNQNYYKIFKLPHALSTMLHVHAPYVMYVDFDLHLLTLIIAVMHTF